MGWNTGYTIFEETVIGAYNLGKLDKDLLTVLMEPYRDSDIDSGGSHDLRSNDGKTVVQIVIETWGLKLPIEPTTEYAEDRENWDAYLEDLHGKFNEVTEHFNWC